MIEFSHKPVLLEECMQGLALKSGGVYFDGTEGGGNHSFEILRRTFPDGRLIGTDLDDFAIAAATAKLAPFGGRFRIYKSNFKEYERVLEEDGTDALDGVLLDLGVSSFQLDEVSRGFTYRQDAPLDMRMDEGAALSAEDVVNGYPQDRLARIIREYGEERFASRIAENIAKARAKARITRTGQRAKILDFSGDPHRSERGTRRSGRSGKGAGEKTEKRRTHLRHHLSLAGRPHREKRVPRHGKRLHMRQEPARLRLRKKERIETGEQEADNGFRRGTERKPALQERKAAHSGASLRRS